MLDNLSPNMKAAIFTVVAGAIGTGEIWLYNIGYNNGARDIVEVEKFKDKLPTMIDNLNKVSSALSQTAQMIDENTRLREQATRGAAQIKDLEQKVTARDQQVSAQSLRINQLQAGLEKLAPISDVTVTVHEGAAERVIPGALTVGVTTSYGSFVDAGINGESASLRPTQFKTVELADRSCKVELLKIENKNVTFQVSCFKKDAAPGK
jgi:seryl-tRNA synthetase